MRPIINVIYYHWFEGGKPEIAGVGVIGITVRVYRTFGDVLGEVLRNFGNDGIDRQSQIFVVGY
jgi:hypothetical protein